MNIQEHTQQDLRSLPLNSFQEIPTPNNNAQQITGLLKERGRVVGYQLEDGSKLSKEQAIDAARQGGIRGVGIARRKDSEYLRSLPDGTENNNLSSLPTIPS